MAIDYVSIYNFSLFSLICLTLMIQIIFFLQQNKCGVAVSKYPSLQVMLYWRSGFFKIFCTKLSLFDKRQMESWKTTDQMILQIKKSVAGMYCLR